MQPTAATAGRRRVVVRNSIGLAAMAIFFLIGCRAEQPMESVSEPVASPETNTVEAVPTVTQTRDAAQADAPEPSTTPEPATTEPTDPPATDVESDSGPFERVTLFDFAEPDDLLFARLGPGPDEGSLWVYTESSAALYKGDESVIDSVDEEERIVGVDERGRMWFSRIDGTEIAYVAENLALIRFGAAEGWEPIPGYTTVLEQPRIDSRGWVWIGTPADLRVLREDRWEVVTPPDMPIKPPTEEEPQVSSFSLAMIGDQVWVGHCYFIPPGASMNSEGVRYFDGEAWQATPIRDVCSRDIRQDGAGNLWAGARDSLWRMDSSTKEWSSQSLPEVADAAFVYLEEFLAGPNGDLWPVVVLCGGASCYGSVNLYHAYSGGGLALVAQAPYSGFSEWKMFTLADGSGLLLWEGRLNTIENDRLSPLVDVPVIDAYQDRSGQVWALVSTETGVELWRLPGS